MADAPPQESPQEPPSTSLKTLVLVLGACGFASTFTMRIIDPLVPTLADHFGRRMAAEIGWNDWPGFGAAATDALMEHRWPGNVRELRNVVERAVYRWERDGPNEARRTTLTKSPKTLKRLETTEKAYDTNPVTERPEQFNGRTAQPSPNPNPARRCLSSEQPN